jgi:hypothetical protein
MAGMGDDNPRQRWPAAAVADQYGQATAALGLLQRAELEQPRIQAAVQEGHSDLRQDRFLVAAS